MKNNNEEYTLKIKELEQTINSQSGETSHFNVFCSEAGLGKSRETLRIVDESFDDWNNSNRYLIVKKFKKDVEEAVEYLSHRNKTGFLNILGVTSENWIQWKTKYEKLRDVRVMIITHQRYIDLCLNDEIRHAFVENRNVLIIDEKIKFPTYTFSKAIYDQVRSMLHTSIQQEYDKVCNKLLIELQKHEFEKKKNKVIRCKLKIHPATLRNFINLMNTNIENENDIRIKNALRNFIAGLNQWYSTKCLYNAGNISTFNHKHKLWGLQKNIILDASAYIDNVYKLGNFKLFGHERIISHSNSHFTIINFNTSKSSLRLNQSEFNAEISKKINNSYKVNDKTLIICHKDNHKLILEQLYKVGITRIGVGDEYDGEDFAINWFGNLIGKNEYSKFTQCWIIGTPNIPYEQYLIDYMMYRETDLGRKSTDIKLGRFVNDKFKAVQIGYIASEIYQSIKRIQRNQMPQGEFFIVNSDQEVLNTVLSQIKDANKVNKIEMEFQQIKKSKEHDNVEKFLDYFSSLPKGMYKKKDIFFKALGITNNFNRILTDARIQALLSVEGGIGLGVLKIHNKHIEKLVD
ncbi:MULTISPECIES: hypothetical protein [Paenibacillus]|uniref:hypothetical protein n=1 Tax=Paenibacillus TaxID=44249 RepID=UPI001354EDD2|nr:MULTISPECIES: hypothetical protein [Paenibacillus]MDY8025804.1 hypothetical protein [Paenibacillus polymyxa]MXO77704.1 hypothetical protein [Paenibacillus sp. OT2-17]